MHRIRMAVLIAAAFCLAACASPSPRPPAAGDGAAHTPLLLERQRALAEEFARLQGQGIKEAPYQTGRAEVLLGWMEDAARRGSRDEFRRAEESLAAALDELRKPPVQRPPAPAAAVPETPGKDPTVPLKRELADVKIRMEELQRRSAADELTMKELKAQLDDARRNIEEMGDNVLKFSTSQVSALHAEARVMVERLESDKTSPRAKDLAGYAREHLKAGEEQLRKGNKTGAIFYFSQISGIYSRSQRRTAP